MFLVKVFDSSLLAGGWWWFLPLCFRICLTSQQLCITDDLTGYHTQCVWYVPVLFSFWSPKTAFAQLLSLHSCQGLPRELLVALGPKLVAFCCQPWPTFLWAALLHWRQKYFSVHSAITVVPFYIKNIENGHYTIQLYEVKHNSEKLRS